MAEMTEDYAKTILQIYQSYLSRQQYRTIRGQINAGDYDGAVVGIHRIVHKETKRRKE